VVAKVTLDTLLDLAVVVEVVADQPVPSLVHQTVVAAVALVESFELVVVAPTMMIMMQPMQN
jgi:hypothetical protein